jgi:Rod binding domain-containing protein
MTDGTFDLIATRAEPRTALRPASMAVTQNPSPADRAVMRKAAEDLESVFLAQMLRPMIAGIGAEAPFGGGLGEDLWRQMQADELGKAMVGRGGIGLADAVMREMIRLQETGGSIDR